MCLMLYDDICMDATYLIACVGLDVDFGFSHSFDEEK